MGALVVNRDKWEKMPSSWHGLLYDITREYSKRSAEVALERAERALSMLIAEGAIVSKLPPEEKIAWMAALPMLAKDWVTRNEEQGLPAKRVLLGLLEGLRKRGVQPMKAWDLELR